MNRRVINKTALIENTFFKQLNSQPHRIIPFAYFFLERFGVIMLKTYSMHLADAPFTPEKSRLTHDFGHISVY